jgi:hypothetical protein
MPASEPLPSAAPTRPATALGLDLPAGKEFIGYYVDLLNYTYATGDTTPLLTGPQVESSVDFGTRDHFMTTD